jgi:RNA polymerase sigma-70 factor, ECF subfamily
MPYPASQVGRDGEWMPDRGVEAFEREVRPHLDALHRTARRLMRDATAAEDLVQEALLKAWRFFHSFRAGTNFKAWIFRVLYTVFVSLTRERKPPLQDPDSTDEIEARESPLEELARPSIEERERAVLEAVDDRVKAAVEELPADLRTTFLLSTLEGLKYREIAEVMDCPLGTVMSRLFRSRRMLQDRLAHYARGMNFPPSTRPAS